jgi:uncharacterized phage protein gp47/JayE
MAFEPKKFNDIFEDMRGRTTTLTDFEVGSVTRTMLESFSFEMGLLYQKMSLVYLSGFVDSATGSHLDNVVAVLGIQRGLPDFAVGKVTFIRDKGNAELTIPVGTLVATEEKPDKSKKVYVTLEDVLLIKDQQEATAPVQALERGQEQNADIDTIVVMPRPIVGVKSVSNTEGVKLIGRRRETDDELRRRAKNALLASGKANISAVENAVLALSGVLDVKVIEDFKPKDVNKDYGFGMIKVVVDASDYTNIYDTLSKTVKSVRAAGVYADIQPAQKITVNGTFRVEAINQQSLSDEESTKFEQKVKEAIQDFLREIKMGDPLSISKLMKAVLTLEGVDNLPNYKLLITKTQLAANGIDTVTVVVPSTENTIKSENTERFSAGDIFVASKDKILTINIQFQATGLTANKMTIAKTNINKYLNGLDVGADVDVTEIKKRLKIDLGDLANVNISVRSWSKPAIETLITANYTPLFVEKLNVEHLVGYNSLITIESTLLLTVANTNIAIEVKKSMTAFLEALPPNAPIVLTDILADIKKTTGVVEAQWTEDDFIIKSNNLLAADKKIVDGKIIIADFEKAALSPNFLIATAITNYEVTFAISIKIRWPHAYTDASDKARVIAVLTNSLTSFCAPLKNGQTLKFNEVQDKIQDTDIGFLFKIEGLSLSFQGINQPATLLAPKDFKFKISERAVFKAAPITITAEAAPIP